MREKNNPVVADELVEVDGSLGRLGLEIGGLGAEPEGFWSVAHCVFCARAHVSRVQANSANMWGKWRGRRKQVAIPES